MYASLLIDILFLIYLIINYLFCCLINFDFLLSHIPHFDKGIILPLFEPIAANKILLFRVNMQTYNNTQNI